MLTRLAEYGLPALIAGMEAAASVGSYAYAAVRTKLAQGQYSTKVDTPILKPVQIKQVDQSAYDSMIAGGEPA